MKIFFAVFLGIFIFNDFVFAQNSTSIYPPNPYPATSAAERYSAFLQRKKLDSVSIVNGVSLNSIGPSLQSCRVTDISVSEKDPSHFYVAYASGGLWKTINNGQSFTPVFDNQETMTIGAIAVDWNHGETIYVGTGEVNSSRSSYSGNGVYKSIDSGKTWQHLGLDETQHIGRIIISQNDPNTIWVAALGHLYSPNKERGIYKTTDGGKTWKQTLFVDENTGAVDIEIDPNNANILYASAWHRERRAWDFSNCGKTSGIYKSTDAGETWNLISTPQSGFVVGDSVGRIGLCVSPKNSNIIYAVVDNNFHRPFDKNDTAGQKLNKLNLAVMSSPQFLALKDEDINKYLDANGFPEKYNAEVLKSMIRKNKIKPIDILNYTDDENARLFKTPIIGGEIYRSDDAGKTWKKMNQHYLDGLFFTYGYYFARIFVAPENPNKIYATGFTDIKSNDSGKTFTNIGTEDVHPDNHILWCDPNHAGHLIVGNDGGLNISYDDGKTWFTMNTPPVGQFYSVNYDMAQPFNVYGGLQDNGVWTGPSSNSEDLSWLSSGQYGFKSIMGGDGMQVAIDTRDNNTVYTGYQYGNYYRVNKTTGDSKFITPQQDLGDSAYRWNWESPIQISKHNQDIIYFGSNRFNRSLDQGDDFKAFSTDLTNGGKKGNVPYGTLVTIDESPLRFGLIYTGSDDGIVSVSKDDGDTWTNISAGLPQNLYVSRVTASNFSEARVYVSMNGYRWDDFISYLFLSEDYGKTWKKIGADLPNEPINVVKEDPANENILYVGTDGGLYISLNKGKSFMRWSDGFPSVPVHDLVIQPRDHEIVLGTHGRSLYVGNVNEIEQLNDSILSTKLYIFKVDTDRFSKNWGAKPDNWTKASDPSTSVSYFIPNVDSVQFTVETDNNIILSNYSVASVKGINYSSFPLSIDSTKRSIYFSYLSTNNKKVLNDKRSDAGNYYLQPGTYTLLITDKKNKYQLKQTLVINSPRRSKRNTGMPHPDESVGE
jgi:photosystem II stability/assembly factor-like uncharacterized protein